MRHHKYLIIGGGMTGDAAVQGIREVDPTGSIGILSAENDPPYNRPPLTKAVWKGEPLDTIWRKSDTRNVDFHLGCRVAKVDPRQKLATDERGTEWAYDRLLFATGGSPRQLPFGEGRIIYYRTVEDYRRLRALADKHKRFAVIGSGFIGSEIAAALAMNGKEVVMVFPSSTICHGRFPAELSQFVTDYYRGKGVEIFNGETVAGVEEKQGQSFLRTKSGREIAAAGIIAGIGIEPNVQLARAAGLKIDDGIVVNDRLQTTQPDVYAAGDAARFFNPALGKHLRVEHEDNANTMGRMAGRNMAGKAEPYEHLPFFYSDLFDLGYEAVGELDARLETVVDWKTPFREGVIYYLREKQVRGVLLWNVWGKVDAARALIAKSGPVQPSDLKGRITS